MWNHRPRDSRLCFPAQNFKLSVSEREARDTRLLPTTSLDVMHFVSRVRTTRLHHGSSRRHEPGVTRQARHRHRVRRRTPRAPRAREQGTEHRSTRKNLAVFFHHPGVQSVTGTRRSLARDRADDALTFDYPFSRRVHRTSTSSSRSPRVATSPPPRSRTTLPTAPRRPALRPPRRGRRTRRPRSRPPPRAPPSAPSPRLPPRSRRAPAEATSTRLRRSRWPSPPPPPRRPRRLPPPRRRRWRRASVPPTTSSCACSHRLPPSDIPPRDLNPTRFDDSRASRALGSPPRDARRAIAPSDPVTDATLAHAPPPDRVITGTRLGSTGDITPTPSPPGRGRCSPRRRTRAPRSPPPFSRCAPPPRPIAARASRRKNPRCLFPLASVPPAEGVGAHFSETRSDTRSDPARGSHPPIARQTPRAPTPDRSPIDPARRPHASAPSRARPPPRPSVTPRKSTTRRASAGRARAHNNTPFDIFPRRHLARPLPATRSTDDPPRSPSSPPRLDHPAGAQGDPHG